jgi:hypothetical protein
MYLRSDGRGPAMNNRLALRIALFGGVALALFGVLFFRLWFLQILNGEKYLAEANNNRTRSYRVIAPRGEILDRSGRVIVDNTTSLALQVNPQKLPLHAAKRRAELSRLADLTHSTLHRVRKLMHEQLVAAPAAPVTLRRDVGHYLVFYLEENRDRFPGVEVQRVFVRHYPHGTLAAHILGNVGEVSEEQLKEPRYKGLQPGDEVGQEGAEDTYDRYLRPADQERAAGLEAAGARRQPQALDRLGGAGSRRSGARRLRAAGRLHHDERAQRRNPRPRLGADLRTLGVHPAADPEPGQRAVSRSRLGAADRSGDRRAVPHRVDLQADHRDGGSQLGRQHAGDGGRRRRLDHRRRAGIRKLRRRRLRRGRPGGSAEGLL